MTEQYQTPGSHNLHIPCREEFHKIANNKISISDFNTDHTQGHAVERVASAITWSKKLEKVAKQNKSYKEGLN